MRKFIIIAILIITAFAIWFSYTKADDVLGDEENLGATVCFPYQGCTGTGTVPTYGQVLLGNSGGTYTPTATSSLGITSYWTQNGTSIYYNDGNVGIGSTSPEAKLSIEYVASGATSTMLQIAAASGSTDNIYGLNVAEQTAGSYNYNIYSGPSWTEFDSNLIDDGWFYATNVFATKKDGYGAIAGITETSLNTAFGMFFAAMSTAENPLAFVDGMQGGAYWSGTGTATGHFAAIDAGGVFNVSTGTMTTGESLYVQGVVNYSTGTIINAYGIQVNDHDAGSGSITNAYGLNISDQTAGGTNYAIKTNETAGANNYALYNAGSAKSYFAGNIGISTTSPYAKLSIQATAGGTTDLFAVASSTNGAATSTAFIVKNNGYVGIGTNIPQYKLSVQGSAVSGISDGIRSDMGFDINPVPNPATLTGVATAGAGLEIGNYTYVVTYTTALGETNATYSSAITTTEGNQQITLTLPISSDPRVTGRKLYRSKVGGGVVDYAFTAPKGIIADNTTTIYVDDVPDASLPGSAYASRYRVNTTSNFISINGTRSMVMDANLTALGLSAGSSITTGGLDSFFGYYAGNAVTTGMYNTYVGDIAGKFNVTGSWNTAVGSNALRGASGQSHSSNTAVGNFAGASITTGSSNTYVGYYAGYAGTSVGNRTFIGYTAGDYETASNKVIIDTIDRVTEARGRREALIYGETSTTLTSQILALGGGGNVGIGTTSPYAKLSIQATAGGSTDLFAVASSTSGAATSTAFIVKSNGYVGIGTASPLAKLDYTVAGLTAFDETNAIRLGNSADASAGVQQYSPALILQGSGWKTTATASSASTTWAIYTVPVQGSSAQTGRLYFASKIGSAAWNAKTYINSDQGEIFMDGAAPVIGKSTTVSSIDFNDGGLGAGMLDFNTSSSLGASNAVSGVRFQNTTLTSKASGTASLYVLNIPYTIDLNASVASGTMYGIYTNATETNLRGLSHYLIDTQVGSVSKFNVKNDGTGYFAGNLGIGTTSPYSLLDVNGNVSLENQGQLRLYQTRTSGAYYASLSASTTPAMSANVSWTLPRVDGSSGQMLTTNGAGSLSWADTGNIPYASLSSSVDQTCTVANTAYAVTFDTNDTINKITHSTSVDNATTTIDYAGTYEIVLSAIAMPDTVNKSINLFLNVENSNVANSDTRVVMPNSVDSMIAVSLIYTFTAGQKFQIRMSSDDAGTILDATAAAAWRPASPSVIMTIKKISIN